MGIYDKFSTFCSNLRMKVNDVDSIKYRYERITQRLNKDYWGYDSKFDNSLYVGSYGRGTDIHVSDIDILFKLPYSVYERFNNYSNNKQSALLQEVKAVVEKTYNSSIKADGQVIKIDFTDDINFELVPCFLNENGSFTIPDTNAGGRWAITNPRPEISEITSANLNWNKNLKRLCRMARAWKYKWSVPIGGLLIDTLAYNFLKNWHYKHESFTYYDWMTRDFFEYLKSRDEAQNYWLSPGANQYVWRKGKFENKAKQCYKIALEALVYEEKKHDYSANLKWREIYGSKFPI